MCYSSVEYRLNIVKSPYNCCHNTYGNNITVYDIVDANYVIEPGKIEPVVIYLVDISGTFMWCLMFAEGTSINADGITCYVWSKTLVTTPLYWQIEANVSHGNIKFKICL